jgi:hypothetical protein
MSPAQQELHSAIQNTSTSTEQYVPVGCCPLQRYGLRTGTKRSYSSMAAGHESG